MKHNTKPMIVTVINNSNTALRDSLSAKRHGSDFLELRFDLLFHKSTAPASCLALAKKISKSTHLPIIATIRLKSEGGEFSGTETARLSLFNQIMPAAEFVDIELESGILKDIIKLSRRYNNNVIISYHNFRKTPALTILKKLVSRASAFKPDMIKIATMINKPEDYLALSSILPASKKPVYNIAIIPMSKSAVYAKLRLFTALLPTSLAYFSASNKAVAPGQFSIGQYAQICRK